MTKTRILLLTGPVGGGKTTVAERVVRLARRQRLACGGLLAPALLDADGHKVGIWGMDLSSGERRILARTDRTLGGPRLGPYSFDAGALDWAVAVVMGALPSGGARSSPPLAGGPALDPERSEGEGTEGGYSKLLVVDEIGTLELWYGQGLAPILPRLAAGDAARALVIVRDLLLDELQRRLVPVAQIVFSVSQQNRGTLPAQILEALFKQGPSRP